MKDTANAIASFFERLGRFFDIFDLSFIVSGAAAVGAVITCMNLLGIPVLPESTSGQAVSIVLSSYIAGLLCFASGRWLRMGFRGMTRFQEFDSHFANVLEAHGLDTETEVISYLLRKRSRGVWRLYVRFWAEVRETPELANSLSLVNRYWVMAAMYDGLAVSLLAWIITVCVWTIANAVSWHVYVLSSCGVVLLSAMIAACSREAGRYVQYQIEEVVAAIVYNRLRMSMQHKVKSP